MSVKTFSIEEEIKRADTEPPALAKYDGMVRKVYTLKESQCFPKLWKLKAEQAKGKFPGEAILSLDEAQENIYNPAMEDFEKTYRSLKDCSINFGSIKRQFKTVIKEKVLLKKEFEIMENSMGEAGSKRSWVETAMDKIHNYETLSTVVQTAQMINELRRELGLDGDFQILDDLTRYVCRILELIQFMWSHCIYFMVDCTEIKAQGRTTCKSYLTITCLRGIEETT